MSMHKWLLFLVSFGACSNALSVTYRSGSLSYLYGDNYLVETTRQQTITFEYVLAVDWGDMFMFIDAKHFEQSESGLYGEFSPRINLYKFDSKHLISKITFATTFERGKNGVKSNLFGFGLDFNSNNFRYLTANLYQRNSPNQPGRGYQITSTWAYATDVAEIPILIDGYIDWTFSSDETSTNLHINPQLKLDMKQCLGGTHQWYLGIEYDYWKNKFGIKDSTNFETNQNTWSLLIKWHF